VKIGIGLPNPIPGTPGVRLVEWARRAEARGFSTLTTIDRIAYPSYDSLTSLAAAAGATSQIELMTNILLTPVYEPVMLAKIAASIDQISDGRLTLGLAVGGRPDDFAVTGHDLKTRGRDFDTALELMHRAWHGEAWSGTDKPISPTPVRAGRVPIVFGGTSEATIRRVVKWGTGWTAGGGGAEMVAPFAEKVREAWKAGGREGEPRLTGLGYFALGDDARQPSFDYLKDYYAFIGPWADAIADGALRTPEAVKAAVQAFEDAGFTDFFIAPASSGLDQVDRLADAVL
jgi:alkanesulfonate monooxygenase SsuD/methylene tetrahydromethanopterin reductase-like flavin-dependent oxidoreductase (luciferase family)